MEVSGQLYSAGGLTPMEDRRHPLCSRLSGLQSRCGRGGEEKASLSCPFGESNTGRPAVTSLDSTYISLGFLVRFATKQVWGCSEDYWHRIVPNRIFRGQS
jgi:hypothetical protein